MKAKHNSDEKSDEKAEEIPDQKSGKDDEIVQEKNNSDLPVPIEKDIRPRRTPAKVLAGYLYTSEKATPSASNMIRYVMISPSH